VSDEREARLWPALLAVAVAAAVAAVVIGAVVAHSRAGEDRKTPAAAMPIVVASPVGGDRVRAVTQSAGCKSPVAAKATVTADAVELRVVGRAAGGGCVAATVLRCNEARLRIAVGRRRIFATPVGDQDRRAAAESLIATGPCPPLPSR
jgi:hypothetical protein